MKEIDRQSTSSSGTTDSEPSNFPNPCNSPFVLNMINLSYSDSIFLQADCRSVTALAEWVTVERASFKEELKLETKVKGSAN